MDDTLRYIEEFREATKKRLTVTHLMAQVVGQILCEMPEINVVLRWNTIYLRKEISAFFQVAIVDDKTGAVDLSGLKIKAPHQKSLVEIIEEFEARVDRIRARKDKALERTRRSNKAAEPCTESRRCSSDRHSTF